MENTGWWDFFERILCSEGGYQLCFGMAGPTKFQIAYYSKQAGAFVSLQSIFLSRTEMWARTRSFDKLSSEWGGGTDPFK